MRSARSSDNLVFKSFVNSNKSTTILDIKEAMCSVKAPSSSLKLVSLPVDPFGPWPSLFARFSSVNQADDSEKM